MKSEFVFPDDGDRLLSLKEVAGRLKTSPGFVGRIVNAGLLPVLRFRREKRVRKFTLNDFLKKAEGKDLYDLVEAAEGTVQNHE